MQNDLKTFFSSSAYNKAINTMLHVSSVETLERLTPFIAFISSIDPHYGLFLFLSLVAHLAMLILHEWNKKFSIKLHNFFLSQSNLFYYFGSGNSLARSYIMKICRQISLTYREGWCVKSADPSSTLFLLEQFCSLLLMCCFYRLLTWKLTLRKSLIFSGNLA